MSKKRKKKKKADGGVGRSPDLTRLGGQDPQPGNPVSRDPGPAAQPPTADPSYPPLVDGRQLRVRTGKRSRTDEFVKSSLYLRQETKFLAMRQLQDEGAGEDFSELAQRLLEEWLESRELERTDP